MRYRPSTPASRGLRLANDIESDCHRALKAAEASGDPAAIEAAKKRLAWAKEEQEQWQGAKDHEDDMGS